MGMIYMPDIDFEKYLEDNEELKQKVQLPSDFADKAVERLTTGNHLTGDTLPWSKTWDKFRFRDGELTIWAGTNGSGKSLVMGMTALFMQNPVVIASMEMLPEATLARMVRQAAGVSNPSEPYIRDILHKLDNKVWIFNQVGNVSQNALFGMVKYAARELGIKHVMIDSLVKCGLGVDDYNAQKHFVDKLTSLAKDEKVHIHLVVHMRKLANENETPDKHSIKGAGEISDLADNVIIITRKTLNIDPESTEPAGFIRIAKHRHGEWEGNWGFWFHDESQQWIANPSAGAIPFPAPNKQWSANG
jgi:twinkle protein